VGSDGILAQNEVVTYLLYKVRASRRREISFLRFRARDIHRVPEPRTDFGAFTAARARRIIQLADARGRKLMWKDFLFRAETSILMRAVRKVDPLPAKKPGVDRPEAGTQESQTSAHAPQQ
jgi:hypothetical protein